MRISASTGIGSSNLDPTDETLHDQRNDDIASKLGDPFPSWGCPRGPRGIGEVLRARSLSEACRFIRLIEECQEADKQGSEEFAGVLRVERADLILKNKSLQAEVKQRRELRATKLQLQRWTR